MEIEFGIIRKTFAEQFINLGIEVREEDLDRFKKIDKAISMLYLHSYIGDSTTKKLRNKLADDLFEAVLQSL